jgi:hypothetical protein
MTESIESSVARRMQNLVDRAGRRMGNRPTKLSAKTIKYDLSRARANAERQMYEGLK